ncbi:MAG TPA: hypothetical protein VFZ42_12540 [Chitinophagaceae bacterium]
MATATISLITALREAAQRLNVGAHYAWGNHGACNCGHLLQVMTPYSEQEILRYAHTGIGEWTELGEDYCMNIATPLGLMVQRLQEAGLTATDIHHIEYLSDKKVLQHLPGGFRWLKKNRREDVILYFEAFANMLEESYIKLPVDVKQLLPEHSPVTIH